MTTQDNRRKTIKSVCVGALLVGAGASATQAFGAPRAQKSEADVDAYGQDCAVPRNCHLKHLDSVLEAATAPSLYTRARDAAVTTARIGTAPAIGYAANWWMDRQGGPESIASALGRRAIVQSTVLQAATLFTQPQTSTHRSDNKQMREAFRLLAHDTQGYVSQLPAAQQASIAAIDTQIAQAIAGPTFGNHAQFLMRLRQGAYLAVPTRLAGEDATSLQARTRIDAQQATLIADYPQSMQATLDGFVWEMRYAALTERPSRAQAYLYGPPGTGKSRFVQRLSEALSLPLCHITIGEDDNAMTLLGPAHEPGMFIDHPREEQFFGKIPRCFLETGISNPILFFDELGDRLNDPGFLPIAKIIFDPNLRMLSIAGLHHLPFDYSRATVILSGNTPLTDAALRQRTQQITFAGLGVEDKHRALRQHIQLELQGVQKVLTQPQLDSCAAWVEELMPAILETDAWHEVPGVRVAQHAASKLVELATRAVLSGKPFDTKVARARIHDTYTRNVVTDTKAALGGAA